MNGPKGTSILQGAVYIYICGSNTQWFAFHLPDKGGRVIDPPSTDPNNTGQSTDAIDNHGTKGSGGVDSTPGKGNKVDVGQQYGPTNGDGCGVGGTGGTVHGRMQNGKDQEVGSHQFQKKGRSDRNAVTDLVESNRKGRAVVSRGGNVLGGADAVGNIAVFAIDLHALAASPHDKGSDHRTGQLCENVQGTGEDALVPQQHESKGNGGVDVSTGNVSDSVGQDGNTNTKGNGNCELL